MLRKPVEHFLKAVDEVTAKDIATIAQRLFESPLTLACYGDGNLLLNISFFLSCMVRFDYPPVHLTPLPCILCSASSSKL